MAAIFRNLDITADHASGKVSRLIPMAFFPKENPSGVINEFSALLPEDSPPRALVDIPTGFFTWDLLDAFPNSTVSLAVRTVRAVSWSACGSAAVFTLLGFTWLFVSQADSWCDSYFRCVCPCAYNSFLTFMMLCSWKSTCVVAADFGGRTTARVRLARHLMYYC